MLENIKSIFFIKFLFSHIYEEIKLKLIKYNKKIQNNLNIGLINYKVYYGKYIIYEEKGIGKIYNALYDQLIYESEILNGKKWKRKGI